VAQYASKCTYKGIVNMWQYTSGYSLNGKHVDASYCYSEIKTAEALPIEEKKEEPMKTKKKITEADCIDKMIEIALAEVGYL